MEEVTDNKLPDNQTACIDRSINADLVDTRSPEDEPAEVDHGNQ